MRIPPVPPLLSAVGMIGNAAASAVLWDQGNMLCLLTAFGAGITFITTIEKLGGRTTDPPSRKDLP